MKHIIKNNIM
ncbi:hypothetical protein EC960427_3032A, partial [Escherichia coli 96.0427]